MTPTDFDIKIKERIESASIVYDKKYIETKWIDFNSKYPLITKNYKSNSIKFEAIGIE